MSFTRAFSKRLANRYDNTTPPGTPSRHASLRRQSSTVSKHQISAPMELLSTTNPISYTAPSIRTSISTSNFSTPSSRNDEPSSPVSSAGTPPPLTPDVEYTMDENIMTPPSTPPRSPNHYFAPRAKSVSHSTNSVSFSISEQSTSPELSSTQQYYIKRSNSVATPSTIPEIESASSKRIEPIIPAKSASRSLNRAMSNASIRPSRKSTSTNPFGPELAQVSELAEEMGLDLDEQYMVKNGLLKFNAADYLNIVEDEYTRMHLFR